MASRLGSEAGNEFRRLFTDSADRSFWDWLTPRFRLRVRPRFKWPPTTGVRGSAEWELNASGSIRLKIGGDYDTKDDEARGTADLVFGAPRHHRRAIREELAARNLDTAWFYWSRQNRPNSALV